MEKPKVIVKKITSILIAILFFNTPLCAQERTIASYYSNKFQGRKMSSGLKYDKDSLTCACNSYPLGTLLKITHLKNGKSVIVKVTDKCGTLGRIDLSFAAAKEIDIIKSGIAEVEIEEYLPNKED